MDQVQEITPESVAELVRTTFGGSPGEFRPCAYFDEPLDCIRVIARDCSVTEWRMSPGLTILEDNYAPPSAGLERYVGFTIKGVRFFCKQRGIPLDAPVEWGELLDAIVAAAPLPQVRFLVEAFAKPLVMGRHIPPVSLPNAA